MITITKHNIYKYIQSIWIYIIILLILITTGGALNEISPNTSNLLNIVILIMSIQPIKYFINNKKNIIMMLAIGIIWIFINWIFNVDNIISTIIFFGKIIAIFSIVMYTNIKRINLHEHMYKLISIISIYSLVFYILIQILKVTIPYTVIDTGNYVIFRSYFNIYYWSQTMIINGNHIIRNSSIFWEPGMYQIFLNYCIFYLLFFKKDIKTKQKINIILLIISVFTTTSTTGIILMVILFIIKLYSIKSKSKIIFILKLYTNFIILFGAVIFIIYTIKLKSQIGSISLNERTKDLLIPISLFLQKPLHGWGFLNYDIYTNITGNSGNSNGLTTLLYQTGFIGILFYSYSIKLLIKKTIESINYRKSYTVIAFIIFIIMSNMTEPIIYSNVTLLFLSMGYFGLAIEDKNDVLIKT